MFSPYMFSITFFEISILDKLPEILALKLMPILTFLIVFLLIDTLEILYPLLPPIKELL